MAVPSLTAQNFAELYQWKYLAIYLAICALNTVLLLFSSSKFLLAFQQCGYKKREYAKWFTSKNNTYIMRLAVLCVLAFLFFCVLSTTFAGVVGEFAASYVGFVSYILFVVAYINTERHVNAKVQLKKTRRMVRLCVTYCLFLFAMTFGVITLENIVVYFAGGEILALLINSAICVTPLLAPLVLMLAALVNAPFENLNNRRYINRTKKKLENSDVIKIGITGSYGKTGVKNILTTLLSQKYRVLATPASYNTPLGVALAAKKLDSTHDVFIAEMGARHVGDISDLASLVNPQYAVLTGVNDQHLETFKTEENIRLTKFELFERLPENACGFFSADNDISRELYEDAKCKKYLAGIAGDFVCAEQIAQGEGGSSFMLRIAGERGVKCNTTLLGKHNISNICLAAAVAYKIGLTPKEIAEGVNRLKAVSHRLEMVTNNRDIKIIDDSYNANRDGVKAALEVLSGFSGRKIVLTPGLVELGKDEAFANYEMGKAVAAVADIMIVIGRHNGDMLIKGWLESGRSGEDAFFAKSLAKGNEKLNEIMRAGDVVLFENDLPDTYS